METCFECWARFMQTMDGLRARAAPYYLDILQVFGFLKLQGIRKSVLAYIAALVAR